MVSSSVSSDSLRPDQAKTEGLCDLVAPKVSVFGFIMKHFALCCADKLLVTLWSFGHSSFPALLGIPAESAPSLPCFHGIRKIHLHLFLSPHVTNSLCPHAPQVDQFVPVLEFLPTPTSSWGGDECKVPPFFSSLHHQHLSPRWLFLPPIFSVLHVSKLHSQDLIIFSVVTQ